MKRGWLSGMDEWCGTCVCAGSGAVPHATPICSALGHTAGESNPGIFLCAVYPTQTDVIQLQGLLDCCDAAISAEIHQGKRQDAASGATPFDEDKGDSHVNGGGSSTFGFIWGQW